jgi:hypothetical protein
MTGMDPNPGNELPIHVLVNRTAISEYGAAIWCDPFVWIPEAHRLLRAGGVLAFLGNHPLALVCTPLDGSPTSETLVRDWFSLRRIDWRQVEFDPSAAANQAAGRSLPLSCLSKQS